jgi:DNA ligase 1
MFHPVMLAHAIEEAEVENITPAAFLAEWKYDGIRVQVASAPGGKALFSHAGDDISGVFPEVLACVDFEAVLDGELIVKDGAGNASFAHLRQRLNRKSPDAKLIAAYPGHLILYDALSIGGRDLRPLPLAERKAELARWFEAVKPAGAWLAQPLAFRDPAGLRTLRAQGPAPGSPHIEGLMLKRLDSPYAGGRPKGLWYSWKRDPKLIDAVLMYAQRGAGKDAALYSSFTFGLWHGGALSPIGKADAGFTEEELKELGKWVRDHAMQRFGPVLEVEKALVFEVAFDAVHRSARHKSGVALRGARIARIRWDKPAREADELQALAKKLD